MISILFETVFSSAFCIPCAVLSGACCLVAVCFGLTRFGWHARNCHCLRRFFRWSGIDEFDDFELSAIVHEVHLEGWNKKHEISVRITAGREVVTTDPQHNGVFNEALQTVVEQGVAEIVFDVLDHRNRVLASLDLDTKEQVLAEGTDAPETTYEMRQKSKGIRNPTIKLSLLIHKEGDAERGLFATGGLGVDILVQRELQKVREEGTFSVRLNDYGSNHDEDMDVGTDMEVLATACSGPLELLGRYGGTTRVHACVQAKASGKSFVFQAWRSKEDQERQKRPVLEIEILKIVGVQSDPSRHNIFVISYVDDRKHKHSATFRRVDKARDVWVNILQLLVSTARDTYHERKTAKRMGGAASSTTYSDRSN